MAGQEINCAGTQQQINKKLRMYGFYLQFQDNLSGRTRNLLCRDPAVESLKLRMYGFHLQFQDNLSGRTRNQLCRDPAAELQET